MGMDSLLSEEDTESELSVAYVHALAAEAGYVCGPPSGPDRDSIDLQVSAGGPMRPRLDMQLKASRCLAISETEIKFRLRIKNYDDLRVPTQTPRILVVLHLPHERSDWLYVSSKSLVIRNSAYWISLLEKPETTNTSSVTISIPLANRLDVEKLKELMELSRLGSIR